MADTATQLATLINGMDLSAAQIEQLTQNLVSLRNLSLAEIDSDVAKAKEGSRLTRGGQDLLAKAVAGKELHYTRVAFGDSVRDGAMVELTDAEAFELNDLINWRMDLPMADVSFTGAGTATVKFSVKNAEIEQGFWIREMGLFAQDPDTGEEILYCYRNSGLLSEYIPAGGGAVVWDIIMSLITVVDTATNITAIIDANLAYVSQSEFNQHVNSENPHPNIPNKMRDVTTTTAFWATDEDANLHKISLEDAAKIILGGDASDIPKMQSRLTQAEINMANLFMQLNAERELGLSANLLLVEDFKENKCVDQFSCKVLLAAAGISNIQVETDQNILAGSWYTITDGVHSEYLQVRSVIKNGAAFIVIFEQELVYTYNLDNTQLFRSTALMTGEDAQGAGDIRGVSFTFNDEWSGSGGNVATVLTLDMSQKSAADFTVTGDGGFTTSGEFTITV